MINLQVALCRRIFLLITFITQNISIACLGGNDVNLVEGDKKEISETEFKGRLRRKPNGLCYIEVPWRENPMNQTDAINHLIELVSADILIPLVSGGSDPMENIFSPSKIYSLGDVTIKVTQVTSKRKKRYLKLSVMDEDVDKVVEICHLFMHRDLEGIKERELKVVYEE